MVRKTPVPLLRHLELGVEIRRCRFCDQFVLGAEACRDPIEQQGCRPRAEIERGLIHFTQPYAVSINA